ncbi:MAG: Uma2 family endonuclease [Planctomycetota bacterium]|jgi:Uma2 family endonuclease
MAGSRVTTAEELFALAEDGRFELLHGELHRMTPPSIPHGDIAARIAARLVVHAQRHDLGRVFVESGFLLDRDPDHVRGPDVAFVGKERIPAEGLPRKFWPGPPDLCFEVVSPGDTYAYVQEKACGWIRYGARMVVVVEPERRRVVIHRSHKDLEVLGDEDVLSCEALLPGLEMEVREIFDG